MCLVGTGNRQTMLRGTHPSIHRRMAPDPLFYHLISGDVRGANFYVKRLTPAQRQQQPHGVFPSLFDRASPVHGLG